MHSALSRTALGAIPVAGRTRARLARLWPCALAAALGLVLLYGVGFASPAPLHQATHDARHASGWPCH
jgi:cobalt transporter subunit CbtB